MRPHSHRPAWWRPRLFAAYAVLAAALLALAAADPVAKGPYLQNPTTDGITICWTSDSPTSGTIFCRRLFFPFGPPSAYGPPPPPIVVHDDTLTRYHRVRLSGLAAHTPYAYTLLTEGQSRFGSFVTAARPEQPFRFVAYGDTRTQAEPHAAVVAAVRRFMPSFVIQTGDLVENGAREEQWTDFFRISAPLLSRCAFYPVLGNHEQEAEPYFRYFDVPRDYAFDYGNAHFIILDGSRPPSQFRAQEEWLRGELAAHQDATWRVVALHFTPYSCAVGRLRRAFAERLRARLEPILLAGHVELVICGHDHNYQHHYAHGIHYVVTGGGGAPLIDVRPDTPFVVAARKAYHYCQFRVNGSSIRVRAVQPDGTLIEEFTLQSDR